MLVWILHLMFWEDGRFKTVKASSQKKRRMNAALLLPVFFFTNGVTTHGLLQRYVSTYKTLSYEIQQEILSRWNSSLAQYFLIGGYCLAKTQMDIDFLIQIFFSYFLTDMIHMAFYSREYIYYVHHCIPLLTLYFGNTYLTPAEMQMLVIAGIFLESTTPPISFVWTVSKLNVRMRGLAVCKGFAYLNFLCVRMLYFPYFWYTSTTLLPKMILFPFHCMNIFWFYKMTQYVLRVQN